MSRAAGVTKPQEAQKVKWTNEELKAAKDAGEEYYDPVREDNILGRNRTRLALWEGHLKDSIVALEKALKCVEHSYTKVLARVLCGGSDTQWPALASSKVCGKSRSGRAFGPTWIQWIVCVYAQHPWYGTYQGSTGRMASSFSSWFRRRNWMSCSWFGRRTENGVPKESNVGN